MTDIKRITELFKLFNYNIEGPVPAATIPLLVEWGLIPKEGEYKCPKGHVLKLVTYNNIDGWMWRCMVLVSENKQKKAQCGFRVRLRTGTFFSKSHLSIYQILLFCLMWVKNTPLDRIMEEAMIDGIQTGVDWNSFCREVVVYGSFQTSIQIGGVGIIVEIDESKIGKRKHHRGHHVEGQWVFGGVERVSGKCFIVSVAARNRETLIPIIRHYILPGSTIISDCWKAYDTLTDEGYLHYKVNHSVSFKDAVSGEHTNTIECLWRHLKVSLPIYSRRSGSYDGYVQKFIFMRWCIANKKNAFTEFLKFAGVLYSPMKPMPDAELERIRQIATENTLEDPDYFSGSESSDSQTAEEEDVLA